ncbi:FAD-dependent monooxygenase [Mesorhizobium sp. M1307]|uniref:NAD(P)/FAD-dependent oxidoreductase n=1 Tax=Mesorhizobium sp. M1307 TaxID=2957079 RepID=UPI00333AA394
MEVDAAIVGAGPAGCAAAIRLAQAGASVVLFRRMEAFGPKPGEVISSLARETLSELGLLQSFDTLGFPVLAGSISAWDEHLPTSRDGIVDPYGFGAIVDRHRFEDWLIASARQMGVSIQCSGRNLDVKPDRKGWRIETSDRETAVISPVVVEATGRSSGLLGKGRRVGTDSLVAILQYGRQDDVADQRMLVEASAHGWWYAVPLPDNKAVIAFLTDADLLKKSAGSQRVFVEDELARTSLLREFSAQLISRDYVCGYPANSSIRECINGSTWVAIGDAAATYDPLSGQGISTALAKGASIGRLLASGDKLSACLDAYADAERQSFSAHLQTQRATYSRAAPRFNSPFWTRRTVLDSSH